MAKTPVHVERLIQEKGLFGARKAEEILRISAETLRRAEKEGKLVPFRTVGGHRRYNLSMLREYLENSRR